MIFWITIVGAIVLTILSVLAVENCWSDIFAGANIIISIVLWITVIIMIICIICNNVNAEGKRLGYQKHYEAISYQIANNLYDNDNDYGKRELYNQATSWNCDLAYRKQAQRNFWIGIFYPNIYDDFEYVKLS